MKQIDINNSFLQNNLFLNEKYKFSLVGHNLGLDETIIYSDEESYIFVLGKKHKPIWLWTDDKISNEKVLEIKDCMDFLGNSGLNSFACKESLYTKLGSIYENLEVEELSGCYVCHLLIKPSECVGQIEKASEDDKIIITQMWYDDCVEADSENHISYELAEKFVERFLDSGTFYVWRNNDGKIVSMVDYTIIDDYAEIAHAYTVPEERGKGYMANAVYELTKIVIENGFIPVLSTDYNYIASNKCYQNVGYKLEDRIVVFSNMMYLEKESDRFKK